MEGKAMSNPLKMSNKLIGWEEAAEKLGLTVGALKQRVARRQIPFVPMSRRTIKFNAASIDAFITEREVPAIKRPKRKN